MKFKLIGENNPENYMEQIAKNRGLTLDDIELLFKVEDLKESEATHDHRGLENIIEGAKAILRANDLKSKAMTIVDSDADGYTSSALIYNYIKKNLPNIDLDYFVHENLESKTHGVFSKDIPDGVDLVIVPDAGSQSLVEIKKLHQRGVEVIVLDHHQLLEEDEKAKDYCYLINNQACDYPNKELSGVGIVYKFCKELDLQLGINDADYYLDLVAIGMIADLMNVSSLESRYYMKKGLKNINNPFLKALVKKQSFVLGGGDITFKDVSWSLAPLINATVRYGTLEERKDMFEAFIEGNERTVPYTKRGETEEIQQPIATAMARICSNVKGRQDRHYKKIVEELVEEAEECEDKLLCIDATKHLKGERGSLSGLVAMNLSDQMQKPTLIYKKYKKDEKDMVGGSGRNFDFSPIESLQDFLLGLNMFDFVKGHGNAFGHALEEDKLEKTIALAEEELKEVDFTKQLMVDYVVDSYEINSDRVYKVGETKEEWGQGMPRPKMAVTDIQLSPLDLEIYRKKTNTVKFVRRGVTFVKFKVTEEELSILESPTNVELVGEAEINTYNGVSNPQITIVEWNIEPTKEKEIDYMQMF